MGVPKFFRYVSMRYPCIMEAINENHVPDFDNLYLDMNGIFHTCSHPVDKEIVINLSEEEIFENIFHYIDVLVYLIKPKKLIFLAVDGVAPRAKINQQRGRRFVSARDMQEQEAKLIAEGKQLPNGTKFDPNCITPGTEFMYNLQLQLQYYISNRISTNPLWQHCKVILSGHQVPGEGEHKIMEYIRYSKTLPDYDPYSRHCLYGLDADLIMLAVSLHVYNIAILREEVKYGKSAKRHTTPEATNFFLLHVSVLREYLDFEFQELKSVLPFDYDLTKLLDDWVLLGLIVGNDFIPHLPDFRIDRGAFPLLYKTYKDVLPTLDGYLNENGFLNLSRFQTFMERLAKQDLKNFEETYADLAFFEEKTGRRLNSEKCQSNEEGKNLDPDLEKLINYTNDALGFSDDESDHDDIDDVDEDELFLREFLQHKRDYYLNKLDYLNVTEDVLKSQAEGYIRALQWILFYYYKGCQSWSWYYPHHYAPFTSDIINFKDVNLEFEMGEPFKPFEQLLAVLPPFSKNLLPSVYHPLMVSPNSPIKHYYPTTFETDLNGKQHDWEAVVLLPFVDEVELKTAMQEGNRRLTAEEKRRNTHGPMLIYSYTKDNLGTYEAPRYFNSIPNNHAKSEIVWKNDFCLELTTVNATDHLVAPESDVYFPGFPSFRFVDFEVERKLCKNKEYGSSFKCEKIIVNVQPKDTPDVEKLASELIGKEIYVNWPFLTEARVIALCDNNCNYFLEEEKLSNKWKKKKTILTKEQKFDWSKNVSHLSTTYLEKQGIDIGSTDILVYVNELQGVQQTFESLSNSSSSKIWSTTVVPYPLQVTVRDVKTYKPHVVQFKSATELFPADSVVFMLGYPYYGCMGRVKNQTERSKNGRLLVKLEVPFEVKINKEILKDSQNIFYKAFSAAQRLGIRPYLLANIAGSILIDMSDPEQTPKNRPIVNIGLQLKNNSKNVEVPGYTRKDVQTWWYSTKAIDVVKEYIAKYPEVLEYLFKRSKSECIPYKSDIFGDSDGVEKVKDITNWIKGLECSQIERISCGSQILDENIVKEIEKIVDASPKIKSEKILPVKPHLLFKSDLITRGLPPVPTAQHNLLDRVISVKTSHCVPLGLRGYIIGITTAQSESDYMYDILFDEPFPGGMTLNCTPGRGYKLSRTSFINISHGERTYPVQSKFIPSECPHPMNRPMLLSKERPSSAFAQWNHYPPAPLYEDKAEQFKNLWTYLEKVKSQDETKVLKKILKIEEGEKSNIEDNVKSFFENISKTTENMIAKSAEPRTKNVKAVFQTEKPYRAQLLNFFHARNLSPPNFHMIEVGNRITAQVILQDGRVFTGFPCCDDESAQESAALQALRSLGEVELNNESLIEKEIEKSQKIMEYQAKLLKGILKGSKDVDTPETVDSPRPLSNNNKLKPGGDKLNRSTRSQQQNQRRYNNLPNALPTPPPLWCKQYKTSSNGHQDHYRNTSGCVQDELKLRPETPATNDRAPTSRIKEQYVVTSEIAPTEGFRYGHRNQTWRHDGTVSRSQQVDSRSGNMNFRGNYWRPRGNQNDPVTQIRNRQQIHPGQGNHSTTEKPAAIQVEPQGNCQRLSTEFIPLQALTRNRVRGSHTYAPPKEIKQETVAVPQSTKVVTVLQREEKASPSTKQPRKSKIAAKFNTEWVQPT